MATLNWHLTWFLSLLVTVVLAPSITMVSLLIMIWLGRQDNASTISP